MKDIPPKQTAAPAVFRKPQRQPRAERSDTHKASRTDLAQQKAQGLERLKQQLPSVAVINGFNTSGGRN